MSKEELLRHAEPTVGMGFVPPVLARQVCNTLVPPLAPQHATRVRRLPLNAIMLWQLYPPGAAVSRPWTGAIKDSGAPPAADAAHDQSQVRACVCA